MSQLATPRPWTREHLDRLTEADKDFILHAVNNYEKILKDLRDIKDNVEVEWTERMSNVFQRAENDLKGA